MLKNEGNRKKRGVEGKKYSFKYSYQDNNTIIIQVENGNKTEEFKALVCTNSTITQLHKLNNESE